MNPLLRFYQDEQMRDTLKEFMLNELSDMAVQKVFDKEDISGLPEAKELVEKLFNKLHELYEPVAEPVIQSTR